ncbi:MAG: hypothetical protein HC842_04280 [Cytophagales bacterium]|nr:hypothetical protein [Cytophagales bacterium]
MAIVSSKEFGKVRFLEKQLKATFTKMLVPTGDEVCEQQMIALIHQVRNVKVNEEEINQFLKVAYDELADLSKEELIKRFTSLEFNRFLNYYREARDLNSKDSGRNDRPERGERGERPERGERRERGDRAERSGDRRDRGGDRNGAESGFERFFINIGRKDGLSVGQLISTVCDFSGIDGKAIGRIDLKDTFSFFEVESDHANNVLNNFEGNDYNGRELRVELTDGKRVGGSGDGGGRRDNPGRGRSERGGSYGGGGKSSYGGGAGGGGNFKKKGGENKGGSYGKPKSGGDDTSLLLDDFSFSF